MPVNLRPLSDCLPPMIDICPSIIRTPPTEPLFLMFDETNQLRPYFPDPVHPAIDAPQVTLQELWKTRIFRPGHKLMLAASIASTVLQLHNTPWLSEAWIRSMIFLPEVDRIHPYLEAPLTTSTPGPTSLDCNLNPYLIELGIVLLEMSEETSFADWTAAHDAEINAGNLTDKAGMAWHWVTKHRQSALGGDAYGQVIKRCLAFSGMGGASENRHDIYRDVVHELETIYDMVTKPFQLEHGLW
jgi:hypothetical protein